MITPEIPKKSLIAALIQIQSVPAMFQYNVNNAMNKLYQAVDQKPDIIILPELWSSGYDNNENNLNYYSNKNNELIKDIGEIANKNSIFIFAGSFILEEKGKFFNRSIVFDKKGKIIAKYDKMHLFELFGENKMFKRGSKSVILSLTDGWKTGIQICYDLRFPEITRFYFKKGCNLIVVSSQWPGIRNEHWRTLIIARAIESQSYIIGCNVSERDDKGYVFGGSIICNPWGEVIAEAGQQDKNLYAVLDPKMLSFAYSKLPIYKDIHPFFQ